LTLRDFCFSRFHRIGIPISRVFRHLEADLDAAFMRIHPEIYTSIIGFVAILSLIVPVVLLSVLALIRMGTGVTIFPIGVLFDAPLPVRILGIVVVWLMPLIVIAVGGVMPKLAASNRASKLKTEIPYASMYMSVMTSGGLSPFQSLVRMTEIDLLPTLQQEMKRLQILLLSSGSDPVTAMEQAAKVINLKEYKRLLLGYASTVRRGGDVLHYLYNQTESMFESLSIRIRAMGEHIAIVMETNIIISILGALGLILIFIVALALPVAGMSISLEQFYLFSFVILPVISIFFIYIGDAIQMSEPTSNWKTYMYALAGLPVCAFIVLETTISSMFNLRFFVPQLLDAVKYVVAVVNLGEGTEAALGLSLGLLAFCVPGWMADHYIAGRDKKVFEGVTAFIRDIVETRKTGLSPEDCIIALSEKDYGQFSPHLKLISLKLKWGLPIGQIFEGFREKVNNWISQIAIYFLVDTIEIGGGSEESLETLAEFVEKTHHLEEERRGTLMPLTILPYIGSVLLTTTTVMLLKFFVNMTAVGGYGVPYIMLNKVLLTPLILHAFILGLVSGKLGVSNRISAGFLHSTILVLISVIGIWVGGNFITQPLGPVM